MALTTPDHELARAVARERVASHVTDDPVASLPDSIRLGKAVGLTMSEMQRLSGVARQTLYRQMPSDKNSPRRPPASQARIEVLVLLASAGDWATPALLARSAGLDAELVRDMLTSLAIDGLCTVRQDDYTSLEGAATSATYRALRDHFDDLYLRRPDHFSIYVQIPDNHHAKIVRAAAAVLADREHHVLQPSVAPSVMDGPELAFQAAAPTPRSAILLTRDLWKEILAQAKVQFSEPMITNIIPPGPRSLVPSAVLDAFLEAMVDAGAPSSDTVRQIRAGFTGGASERELAGRCVTMAARALRRTAGNANEPRAIGDGDAAFAEWQPAHALRLDKAGEQVQLPAVIALDLATEHLGPLPGGRIGAVRAPDQPPAIVQTRDPSHQELVDIARHAGEAVGVAATLGHLDPADAMRRVVVPNAL